MAAHQSIYCCDSKNGVVRKKLNAASRLLCEPNDVVYNCDFWKDCQQTGCHSRHIALYVKGSIYPPIGPVHQISLTQITNQPKKENSLITKILMYYESVASRFHAALWSCRECIKLNVFVLGHSILVLGVILNDSGLF